MIRPLALAAVFWAIVAGLPGCMANSGSQNGVAQAGPALDVEQIRKDMVPLDLSEDYVAPASIASYFDF